jgi:hypothetical protein
MPIATRVEAATSTDFPTDKFERLPVNKEEIGGRLIAIVTKGLYTNPLDCVREYVQNGVDAGAAQISIQITGNSVVVQDDGEGMSREELILARGLAISDKDPIEDVGFMGIGIYSGYDLAGRMIVTTKRRGDQFGYRMRVDFAEMRKDEARPRTERSSLFDLLERHTAFKKIEFEGEEDEEKSFTVVELQEMNDAHLRSLSDRAAMRKYMLQNLPVDFADKFAYRKDIDQQLRANVPGFKAVKLILRSSDQPDEVVAKPIIEKLQSPRFNTIKNIKGENIAFYWACLSKETSIGKDEELDLGEGGSRDYAGFVYKYKGFTIGNRQNLRHHFKVGNGALFSWYTGEIYVVDPQIRPNAARNEFEASAARNALEIGVGKELKHLEGQANTYQKQQSAEKTVQDLKSQLADLKRKIAANSISELDAYSELDDIKNKLAKQKAKASSPLKKTIESERKSIEALQKRIRSRAEQPKKKTKAQTTTTENGSSGKKSGSGKRSGRLLTSALTDTGLSNSKECLLLAAAVDAALVEEFGASSPGYEHVVAGILGNLGLEEDAAS